MKKTYRVIPEITIEYLGPGEIVAASVTRTAPDVESGQPCDQTGKLGLFIGRSLCVLQWIMYTMKKILLLLPALILIGCGTGSRPAGDDHSFIIRTTKGTHEYLRDTIDGVFYHWPDCKYCNE